MKETTNKTLLARREELRMRLKEHRAGVLKLVERIEMDDPKMARAARKMFGISK
jgi:hypothetical protein